MGEHVAEGVSHAICGIRYVYTRVWIKDLEAHGTHFVYVTSSLSMQAPKGVYVYELPEKSVFGRLWGALATYLDDTSNILIWLIWLCHSVCAEGKFQTWPITSILALTIDCYLPFSHSPPGILPSKQATKYVISSPKKKNKLGF